MSEQFMRNVLQLHFGTYYSIEYQILISEVSDTARAGCNGTYLAT